MSPLDWRPEEDEARQKFPQLTGALDAAEKLLKKLRGMRNKGRANDIDLEQARKARDLIRNILDAGNWKDAP